MPSFIADNYTERAVISEVPGLHADLRFKYRPCLVEESTEFYQKSEALLARNPRESERLAARLMEAKIIEWDLQDTKGNAVAKTVENILRLNRRLSQRVLGIITGLQPADMDPKAMSLGGESFDEGADAKN